MLIKTRKKMLKSLLFQKRSLHCILVAIIVSLFTACGNVGNSGVISLGQSFYLNNLDNERFEITFEEELEWVIVNDSIAFRLPVTINNKSDIASNLNLNELVVFDSSGAIMNEKSFFIDSNLTSNMRSGATQNGFIYILHNGDGTYSIEIPSERRNHEIVFDVSTEFELGETLFFDEMVIEFGDEVEWAIIDDEFSSGYNSHVLRIPVEVFNFSTNVKKIDVYGPDGERLGFFKEEFFDDFTNPNSENIQQYLHIPYNGDGEYKINFNIIDEFSLDVLFEIQKPSKINPTSNRETFPSYEGVVFTDILEGTVLNLRSGPGYEFDVIDQLSILTPLTITYWNNEWLYVEVANKTGWVLTEAVLKDITPEEALISMSRQEQIVYYMRNTLTESWYLNYYSNGIFIEIDGIWNGDATEAIQKSNEQIKLIAKIFSDNKLLMDNETLNISFLLNDMIEGYFVDVGLYISLSNDVIEEIDWSTFTNYDWFELDGIDHNSYYNYFRVIENNQKAYNQQDESRNLRTINSLDEAIEHLSNQFNLDIEWFDCFGDAYETNEGFIVSRHYGEYANWAADYLVTYDGIITELLSR